MKNTNMPSKPDIMLRDLKKFFRFNVLDTETGIALAMVLIVSAISLAIMAALVYMLTAGTQISGIQKRYKSALEAGKAGRDVTFAAIDYRINLLEELSGVPALSIPALNNGCMSTKLNESTFNDDGTLNWPSACSKLVTIDPDTPATYDLTFELGVNPVYKIYAKITDTVAGNSQGGLNLTTGGVVDPSSHSDIPVVSRPYLYTIEVEAHNTANAAENAKFSVLYEY
jgi:hypothetical protein